jgi:hypothetical protein
MTTRPMPTPLVIVRCQLCGQPLGSLDTMPDDWSGNLTVPRCPKCVKVDPRRVVDVLAQQKAAGFALWLNIPLTELRPHALKAKARGRAVSFDVKPLPQAR